MKLYEHEISNNISPITTEEGDKVMFEDGPEHEIEDEPEYEILIENSLNDSKIKKEDNIKNYGERKIFLFSL